MEQLLELLAGVAALGGVLPYRVLQHLEGGVYEASAQAGTYRVGGYRNTDGVLQVQTSIGLLRLTQDDVEFPSTRSTISLMGERDEAYAFRVGAIVITLHGDHDGDRLRELSVTVEFSENPIVHVVYEVSVLNNMRNLCLWELAEWIAKNGLVGHYQESRLKSLEKIDGELSRRVREALKGGIADREEVVAFIVSLIDEPLIDNEVVPNFLQESCLSFLAGPNTISVTKNTGDSMDEFLEQCGFRSMEEASIYSVLLMIFLERMPEIQVLYAFMQHLREILDGGSGVVYLS